MARIPAKSSNSKGILWEYEGIYPKSWEHAADRAALSAVKEFKGIDEIFKLILSLTSWLAMKLLMLASSVKTSEWQYSNLDKVINVFLLSIGRTGQ
jgi:hypothetical protein